MARKYLVIFDLNGTLLDRVRRSDRTEIKYLRELPSPRNPSCSSGGIKTYLRPHARSLVAQWPVDDVALSIWTSAFARTTMPSIKTLFGDKQDEICEFMWFREQCTEVVVSPVGSQRSSKKILKDLDLVWKHPEYRGVYTPMNTILIDDSPGKARRQPRNLARIPTFGIATDNAMEDTELLRLLEYLKQMVKDSPVDVRDYLRDHPAFGGGQVNENDNDDDDDGND